jgi:hypothetical protein
MVIIIELRTILPTTLPPLLQDAPAAESEDSTEEEEE